MWLLGLVPCVVWGARTWQPRRLRFVGHALAGAGLIGLALLIGHELMTWYPSMPLEERKYIGQRILYVLATSTHLPLVQIIMAGIAFWFAAQRRMRGVSPAE